MQKGSKQSKRAGLGKGLGALIEGAERKEKTSARELPIELIDPNPEQPRRFFPEEGLETLADSIVRHGLLQPITVRFQGDRYELIMGERRWRACKKAGFKTIPAIVKDYSTAEISEIALVENLQRQDLDPIEEAHAYRRLNTVFKLTQESIAIHLGRSRSHVANTMRLLQLPVFLQNEISAGEVTVGQIRPLIGLENEQIQRQALTEIKEKDLNARQVEALVQKLKAGRKANAIQSDTHASAELRAVAERLKVSLGTPVDIKLKSGQQTKGKIEIFFSSEEELFRLLQYMDAD